MVLQDKPLRKQKIHFYDNYTKLLVYESIKLLKYNFLQMLKSLENWSERGNEKNKPRQGLMR